MLNTFRFFSGLIAQCFPVIYCIYCLILSGYLVDLLLNTFRLFSVFLLNTFWFFSGLVAQYFPFIYCIYCSVLFSAIWGFYCSIHSSYLVDLLLNKSPSFKVLLLRMFPRYLVYHCSTRFRFLMHLLLRMVPAINNDYLLVTDRHFWRRYTRRNWPPRGAIFRYITVGCKTTLCSFVESVRLTPFHLRRAAVAIIRIP